MLPEHITLEVVTPSRRILRESVDMIELPGKDGYLGILPGHAPLVTELGIGALSYQQGGQTRYLTIIDGYAEVLEERMIVLAEISERAEEIDLTRARSSAERAQARLAGPGSTEMNWQRDALALERALIRQQVATKGGAVAASGGEPHGAGGHG